MQHDSATAHLAGHGLGAVMYTASHSGQFLPARALIATRFSFSATGGLRDPSNDSGHHVAHRAPRVPTDSQERSQRARGLRGERLLRPDGHRSTGCRACCRHVGLTSVLQSAGPLLPSRAWQARGRCRRPAGGAPGPVRVCDESLRLSFFHHARSAPTMHPHRRPNTCPFFTGPQPPGPSCSQRPPRRSDALAAAF